MTDEPCDAAIIEGLTAERDYWRIYAGRMREQVERLTRELDEANVAAGDYANRLERAFERLTRERDEWRYLHRTAQSVICARNEDLSAVVKQRAELRSLLDACGLDFERMRERALTAEAAIARARAALERITRECDGPHKGPVAVQIARDAIARDTDTGGGE